MRIDNTADDAALHDSYGADDDDDDDDDDDGADLRELTSACLVIDTRTGCTLHQIKPMIMQLMHHR